MKFKDFFKPTTGKVILTIILFVFLGFLSSLVTDVARHGFPLIYYEKGLMPCPPSTLICDRSPDFNFFYLLIDLIIWYLVICLIVFTYTKIRGKR